MSSNVAQAVARMQYGVDSSFKARLQLYFIENQKSSLRIRLFNVFIKVLSCILYALRVIYDEGTLPDHVVPVKRAEGEIKYEYLLWVDTNDYVWVAQTVVAILSIIQTMIIFYISYQGNICQLLFNAHFLLEMLTSFPFAVTIFVPKWRNLYIPAFLNCWLAKGSLQSMMNDLNRSAFMNRSALFRQLMILYATVMCLIYTGMCSIEHLQRAGSRSFDFFTSFYFVIVTFSTVGYGDWYPDTWMSRLCVMVLIVCAIVLLPSQLENLSSTWKERQKSGGDYSGWKNRKSGIEHVVITITHLQVEFISDFLDEFYAHPENQRVQVILLSPAELDHQTRMLLKIPLWSDRVHYVRGSALKDEDLERACLSKAKACFILSARHQNRKLLTDEHTILRSWACKDFAPHVKQYVQVFRPETKMHIEHAEVLICEDEFKYSLLASSVICPGISTFLTLLIHTSRGEEGQKSTENWHRVCGFHSGNEIYHIRVEDSKFFNEFVGKTFTYASFHAHRAYGIGLIAVKSKDENAKIRLNPGQNHFIQSTDTVYYMGLTNEESLFDFRNDLKNQRLKANATVNIANANSIDVPMLEEGSNGKKVAKKRAAKKAKNNDEVRLLDVTTVTNGERRPSIAMVAQGNVESSSESEEENLEETCNDMYCFCKSIQRSYPPVRTYIGTSNTVCHIMKERRPECCLQLDKICIHSPASSANEYKWKNRPIIVAVDSANSGMYNLIIPLRAYYRPMHDLHPIVLLVDGDSEPTSQFLDAIAWFPYVYWMKGKMSSVDNLLRAGVAFAEHVVVVKSFAAIGEEHLADCSTIITVQKIHRMFPKLRMITELVHSSNMRFVHFNPNNPYSLAQSKFEKKERKRGSHMPFMFRLPFAQGGVFSANMMDRILYQAMIKPYVVDLIRLLLGVDQAEGSGYLTSFTITAEDLWIRTYGRLYQKLTSSVADIPIGIFRSKVMDEKTVSIDWHERCRSLDCTTRNKDIYDHVKNRMRQLGMTSEEGELRSGDDQNDISFVLINPSLDLQLEQGDTIYVLRAPVNKFAGRSKINPRRGLKRTRNVTECTVDAEG